MHIGMYNGAAMKEAIWKDQSTKVWKKENCVTHWREQRGVDSYLQWQIRSNCGKILFQKKQVPQ